MIRQAKGGDNDAFTMIVSYMEAIYIDILSKKVYDKSHWEDVKSEMVIHTWKLVNDYDSTRGAKFSTYAYLPLHQLVIRTNVKICKTEEHGIFDDIEIEDETPAYHGEFYHAAQDVLTPDEMAILDSWLHNPSQREAARELDMPRTTHQRKLNLIKDKLKEILA